jgi:hypothetical protein
MARIGWYVLGSLPFGYCALQVLGRRAGSTAEERQMRMPGDELVAQPHIMTNHAIAIEAQPADVWPWLTQMGWHLGGWYTPEWVDRLLFPQNWPSLDHHLATIIPADFIMAGGMLRGIKHRAESGAVLRSSGRSPWSRQTRPTQ